jgi:hypothetical protein
MQFVVSILVSTEGFFEGKDLGLSAHAYAKFTIFLGETFSKLQKKGQNSQYINRYLLQ